MTMEIWNKLAKTDPAHTKSFKRSGGFSGTAMKPIWMVKRLTEEFGPVGQGWGMGEPKFQVVPGVNGEVLVYCTVQCWHTSPENTFYGEGGDKVVKYIPANEKYHRPERWENDDEAFKKAYTDAVGNAFKFLGAGADIHMGLFDDSKYVRDAEAEFANDAKKAKGILPPQKPGDPSATEVRQMLRDLHREVLATGDDDQLDLYLDTKQAKEAIDQCKRRAPHWWEYTADTPADFTPLRLVIEQHRQSFKQPITAAG